jgi:hypothetical protein
VSDENETAERYRQRAEELRLIAANDSGAVNREAILKVAEDYERMANTLEARARRDDAQRAGRWCALSTPLDPTSPLRGGRSAAARQRGGGSGGGRRRGLHWSRM